MNCGTPGPSVHGILQARILEWIIIPSFRGSSQPRDRIQVSRVASGFFTIWAIREAQLIDISSPRKDLGVTFSKVSYKSSVIIVKAFIYLKFIFVKSCSYFKTVVIIHI